MEIQRNYVIIAMLASLLYKPARDTITTVHYNWASTDHHQIVVLHLGLSKCHATTLTNNHSIGHTDGGKRKWRYHCSSQTSVSNGSNPLERFEVKVLTGTELLQRFHPKKTHTVAIGPVLPQQTGHFNITTLAPINYFSSDLTVTCSVHLYCCCSRCSTFRWPICDVTNICWVAIKNPVISSKICSYFTATQRISVGSQIRKQEVKEWLELHNLRTYHVMTQSGFIYSIAAKVSGTVKLGTGSSSDQGKKPPVYFHSV